MDFNKGAYILMKLKKIFYLILATVLIYLVFFTPEALAATKVTYDGTIDESKYPGYKQLLDNVKANLEEQIATKQIVGDYALKDELPKNVSELENDAQYVESSVLQTVVEDLKLPSEDGCSGCFLTTDGKNKSWAEIKALNKSQITNCLLEVPQNIKLELNDGVLTLKAGSKVIVPNGAGVFDEITIDIDKTDTAPVSFSLQCMVYLSNNKDLDVIAITTTYSGSTDAGNNSLWYDTTNNNVREVTTVPNLKGMSSAQVINSIQASDLNVILDGSGAVVSQDIAAEKEVEKGTVVTVTMQTETASGY